MGHTSLPSITWGGDLLLFEVSFDGVPQDPCGSHQPPSTWGEAGVDPQLATLWGPTAVAGEMMVNGTVASSNGGLSFGTHWKLTPTSNGLTLRCLIDGDGAQSVAVATWSFAQPSVSSAGALHNTGCSL